MLRQNRITNFHQFKLLYRGSQNNFFAEKYHQAVDNKAPLFLIILAETGRKFGAFINCKTIQSNDWISDPTGMSFIYSLDHNQTYRLKPGANYRTKAIFGGKKGPQIGYGCDIYISDQCNQNSQSGSNFGGSYQPSFGLEYGSKKAKQFLAGKQNFSILQYQAYILI